MTMLRMARISLFTFAVATPFARADVTYTSIFCTKRASGGAFFTVQLRVPRGVSGSCFVGSASPTVISGPPGREGRVWVPHVVSSYTTNFSSTSLPKPSPPAVTITPAMQANFLATSTLESMKLKDLGTLTTKQGSVCENCRLVTFQKDAVIVLRNDGAYKFLLSDLDETSRLHAELFR